MKITEALIAEHQVFHSLFDYIESAIPRLKTVGEVKVLAGVLEAALKAHSATEDELLLAPLEHCFEQMGQADIFHEEHEEIDRNLGQIQKARQGAAARKLLMAAVLASRAHFDKEERIVFPLAEKSLSPRTLLNLGNAWARQRELASV
jgi:hemerythrin-like domain-containing protein